MKVACVIALLAVLLQAGDAYGQTKGKGKGKVQEKVYRWVDEQGEVHYSETLPPDFRDKKHDVLDEQGIARETDQSLVPPPPAAKAKPKKGELPRDASGMERPEPLYSPEELRARQDALLLLRYDSEQEILDAMQVEVNQLAYDRRLLATSRSSLMEAYRGNIHEAADRQRAGLAVEPDKINELSNLKRRLASNLQSLASLEEREASIRQLFESERERYRKLAAQSDGQEG
jgi:hypothetical protein